MFTMGMDSSHFMGSVYYDAPGRVNGMRQVNFMEGSYGWRVEPAGAQAHLPGWEPFLEHARGVMRALVESTGFDWPEAPPR